MMKKLRQPLRSMLEIVRFSLRLSYQSSPRYFLLRLLLNAAYLVLPFTLIRVSSLLVNLLVQSIGGQTAPSVFYPQFLSLTAMVLLLPLLTRTIENSKQYVEGLHQEILNMRARYLIMQKAASLDVGYFDSAAFYNEMNDANQNGPLVVQITFYILDMLRYLAQFVIAFVVLLQYDALLSLLFAAVILPNVLFQNKQLEAIYSFQREHMAEERKNFYTSHVLTSRQYVKDVKMYNLFPFLSRKFQNCWDLLFTRKRKISRKYTLLLILFSFLPEIVSVLIFFRLGLDVYEGSRTMGDYTYFQGIVGQVLAAMWSFVSLFSRLNDGKLRIQNLMKFLKWENQVRDSGSRTLSAERFTVEFCGVSFRYGPALPLVLENVSFTLDSDRKTALVGNNGSGKSTVIKLLLRFYDPTEGEIRIDGTDIREFTLESLRRQFSTVFQDYCSYAYSVRESVTLADLDQADDGARLDKALRDSGADGFVGRFPHGVDTYLTREYEADGEELSGGQWQKLALARGFFREGRMYILDEPSAALDAEAEDDLFRRFETLYAGAGAVLVSHRLSNITHADQIVVLDQGRVEEMGTHRELMARNGKYAHLYRLQADKYELS